MVRSLRTGTCGKDQGGQRRAALLTALLLAAASLSATGCTQLMAQGQNAEGVRLLQQGYAQGAIDRFQRAIATDPVNPDSYYNLAAAYHQQGRATQNATDLREAEQFYNQCLDYEPNHRDCHRGLAVLLVEDGRDEEAFRLLEGWTERSPANVEAKIELARLWDEFEDHESAKDQLQQALAIDPYNARATAALGRIYEEKGEHEQALAVYARSMERNKLQPEVAARIASIKAAFGPSPLSTPAGSTRTVVTPRTSTIR